MAKCVSERDIGDRWREREREKERSVVRFLTFVSRTAEQRKTAMEVVQPSSNKTYYSCTLEEGSRPGCDGARNPSHFLLLSNFLQTKETQHTLNLVAALMIASALSSALESLVRNSLADLTLGLAQLGVLSSSTEQESDAIP